MRTIYLFYQFFVSPVSSAQPNFIVKPQDQKIGMNGIASFECRASGNPPPSVFWTKEGSQMLMFPDNSYGHIHVTNQGTLQIRGVQKEDAGYFVCSALSVAGSATIRAFLQVTSVDDIPPPIIQIGPANQTLPMGSVAMLPCRAIGMPTPRIRWYKDGMPLQTGQRMIIVQSGSLKIDSKSIDSSWSRTNGSSGGGSDSSDSSSTNQIAIFSFADLQSADTGHYTCTASSESGETSWSASLTVSCVAANGSTRLTAVVSTFFFLSRSLPVHRVRKRKTFHFLHYDYEKLFQFILISMWLASSCERGAVGIVDDDDNASHTLPRLLYRSTHGKHLDSHRLTESFFFISVDSWCWGRSRWQSEQNLWFHFSDYIEWDALMQSVSHKRTIQLALNLNIFFTAQSRGTHLFVAQNSKHTNVRLRRYPVFWLPVVCRNIRCAICIFLIFTQQIFVPRRTLTQPRFVGPFISNRFSLGDGRRCYFWDGIRQLWFQWLGNRVRSFRWSHAKQTT